MRKRLRKKRHLGEFREFGVTLSINLRPSAEFDVFLDDFLLQAVEAQDLQFGGGGSGLALTGYLELGGQDRFLANVERVNSWLATRGEVESFHFSHIEDAWYPDKSCQQNPTLFQSEAGVNEREGSSTRD